MKHYRFNKLLSILMSLTTFVSLTGYGMFVKANEASAGDSQPSVQEEQMGVSSEENTEEDWISSLSTEPIKLTFWHNSDRVDYVPIVDKAFQEKYPNVELEHSYATAADLKNNIAVASAAGTLPSVFQKSDGADTRRLTEQGYLYDITKFTELDNWDEKIIPWIIEQCKYEGDGAITQFPFMYQTFAILYRTDIAEQLGIPIPTTLEEFEANMQTYKDNGYIPFALGGATHHLLRIWSSLCEMYAGSELMDQLMALEASWDCEAVVNAFSKLSDWYDRGFLAEDFLTQSPNDARLMLYAGKAAFTHDSLAILRTMYTTMGPEVENYSMYTIPRGDGGTRIGREVASYLFNSSMTETEAAYAYLYMKEYTNYENEELSEHMILPMPFIDYPMPEWFEIPLNATNEIIEKGGTMMNPDILLPSDLQVVLGDVTQAVILHSMTPEEAAKELQTTIEGLE